MGHRKARFRQPDHRRLKAAFAFDEHPATLVRVQAVERNRPFLAVQVRVIHLAVACDRLLDHDPRHVVVAALVLRPPHRFRPAPFAVRSDRSQRLARYPVVPPLPLRDGFTQGEQRGSGEVAETGSSSNSSVAASRSRRPLDHIVSANARFRLALRPRQDSS